MTATITDEELVRRFYDRSLTRLEWCHRVHVRLAWLALTKARYNDALDRVRRGILALNETFGARSSPDGGYHETLTCAWMQIVAHEMKTDVNPAPDSEAFLGVHAELTSKEYIYNFYSAQRLATVEARTSFVEPDVKPLPAL